MDFKSFKLVQSDMTAQRRVYEGYKTESGVHLEYYISTEMWDDKTSGNVECRNVVRAIDADESVFRRLCVLFGNYKIAEWEGLIVVRNYKSCGWGRERCDRKGHAVFLRPRVDSAIMGSASTGISTSSTKLKKISTFCRRLPPDLSGA